MTLENAKAELEKFVNLKTSMRPAFVQPLLDAVEQKHGHWAKDMGGYWCSVCNEYYADIGYGYNYCPNCGSKMDEVLNVPLRNGKSMTELERLMDEVEDV